jgi:hypothetical protein
MFIGPERAKQFMVLKIEKKKKKRKSQKTFLTPSWLTL